ncbi:MAG: helix-turn-helix transcriptional regulator [Anaerolineales bacterium]|nr:helix-turn-helix transcriptional regulator [Anaerolineales bacterium]
MQLEFQLRWRVLIRPREKNNEQRGEQSVMAPNVRPLTPREWEVLNQVADGKSNHETALELGIAEHTVEQHLKQIFAKLDVRNRTQASRKYYEMVRREAGDGDGSPV